MSSILKVDTIQDQSGNNIINESGNVITIGASGDTITVPAGATLSGDLNASNLTSGTVPDARISGAYTNLTSLTITTADNSHALELVSTDADANVGPRLSLYRNSASPADNDILGDIRFMAEDDASAKLEFAKIEAKALDVSSGSRDTQLRFQIRHADSGNDILKLTPTEAVFNDGSFDTDFRVESNANANMLFVDANNNRVGIGTSAPTVPLMVQSNQTQPLLLKGANDKQMVVETTGGSTQITSYQLKNSAYSWQIENGRSANTFTIRSSGGGERVRIDASGNFGIGTSSPGAKLDVNGNVRVATGNALHFGNSSNYRIEGSNVTNPRIGFITNASEAMRIDSSGRLLIGTTSDSPYTSSTETGQVFGTLGSLQLSNDDNGSAGNAALYINQVNTPATNTKSVRFFHEGTEVGVIDTSSTGIGIRLGGTGTANRLDDYEEGTWTPTTNGDSTGAFSATDGAYTKIGRLVLIRMQFNVSTTFSANNIGGLPFAVTQGSVSGLAVGGIAVTSNGYVNFTVNSAELVNFSNAPNTTDDVYRLTFTYQTD